MARVPLPPIEELQRWSNCKVIEWLKEAGFDDCITAFHNKNINGAEFSRLTEVQLFQWQDIPIIRRKLLIKCLNEIQVKDTGWSKGLRIPKVKEIMNPIKPSKHPPAVPTPDYHHGDNQEEDEWDTDFDSDGYDEQEYEAPDLKPQNTQQNNQLSRHIDFTFRPPDEKLTSSTKMLPNKAILPHRVTLPDRPVPKERKPILNKPHLPEKLSSSLKTTPHERSPLPDRPNLPQKPNAPDKPKPTERPTMPPPRPPKAIPKSHEICKPSEPEDGEEYEIPSSSSSFSESQSQVDSASEMYEPIDVVEDKQNMLEDEEYEIPDESSRPNNKSLLPCPKIPSSLVKTSSPSLVPPPLPGKLSSPTHLSSRTICDENENTVDKSSGPDMKSISLLLSQLSSSSSPHRMPPEFPTKQEKPLPPLPPYKVNLENVNSKENSNPQLPLWSHDFKPSLCNEQPPPFPPPLITIPKSLDIPRNIPVANRPLPPPPGQSESEDLSKYPWYHGNIGREETAAKLNLLNKDGSFLVRDSRQKSNKECPFSLSIFYQGKLFHLQIRERPDKKFALGTEKSNEQAFFTVSELVAFHQNCPILLAGGGKIQQAAGQTLLTAYPSKY